MAFFLVVMLGLTAMAVELGLAYVVSNELKSVADAGALTAAKTYLDQLQHSSGSSVDFTAVETAVKDRTSEIAGRSRVLNISTSPRPEIQIEYGSFNSTGGPYDERSGAGFTDKTAGLRGGSVAPNEITAFRVRAARGENEGNRLPLTFAKMWGNGNYIASRDSVATFAPRDFMLVIDTSASMDDITYVRPSGAVPPPPWNPAESFLVFPPDPSDTTTPWYSPYAPGPSDRYSGYDPVVPQPIQTVLDSSLNFLRDLERSSDFGDRAGVEYFSHSARVKLDLTPVTQNSLDQNFSPLLSNTALYSNLIKAADSNQPPHFVLKPGAAAFDFPTYQYDGPIAIPNGQTNIGDALSLANNTLAAAAGGTQSLPVIILFTDGQPNCAPDPDTVRCFGSDATQDQLKRARLYTFGKAKAAIQQGVLIYPIGYGNIDSDSRALLDEIAYLSGLKNGSFDVGATTDLEEIRRNLKSIFDQIAQLVPFMLAG